jgi:D-3-phosphoglycerate dehydrogenase
MDEDGIWSKKDGQEVRDKTMGIIGYGVIGNQVSVLAEAFNMDVVAYDPVTQFRHGRARSLGSMEEVLQIADVITLHVPGGKANHHIINAEKLKLMKKDAFLINAARGELVDYEALIDALDNDDLAGAAIDVYADDNYTEPEKGEPFDHPLRGHPKVLTLPHIGGSTAEAQANIGRSVALKSLGYLATGNTMGSVNIPQLGLNGLEGGTSRLLNIHNNHAGVMAKLLALVADAGLNIVNTNQKASGEIGYLAVDVEGTVPEDVLTVMKALHDTRRARIISS